MGHHSHASTPSPEEHAFGHPLQRMVPLEMQLGVEESSPASLLRGFYKMPGSQSSSTSSHMFFVDFEAVVDEYFSHYQPTDAEHHLVFVEADSRTPSGKSTSLILRRVKRHSAELAILKALNLDEIRSDPWNPAPNLLYTGERGDDAVLCLERLFYSEDPPLQTVANVIDYIRQALEGLCFLHEHKIVHGAYGDSNGVMMDIGRRTTAGFDRTRFPVRYYRVDFARAQQLPRDADLRSTTSAATDWTGRPAQVPKIGGKLRSLVVAMKGGEYGAEDARKLFEALCNGIDASIYDAPLHLPH
ncbi:hypothetical protein BC826DRAFT_1019338 [Russula brevipes]|nr:hypothetical protein BC826DRAFT_1019338 [Russula brevipes]